MKNIFFNIFGRFLPNLNQENETIMAKDDVHTGIWCVEANIIQERPYGPGGIEKRSGTKHFKAGAKVYIIDWFPGMYDSIIVIGQHRKSGEFIKMVINVTWVENLRVKLVYSPTVLLLAQRHSLENRISLGKEFAEKMYQTIPQWQEELKK